MNIYTSNDQDFSHLVHPSLKRRIRIFLIIAAVMGALVVYDVVEGTLSAWVALGSIIGGGFVGFISSRIFNLSWEHDGSHVVGNIDRIGWIVLGLYVAFEIARSYIFSSVIHLDASSTALTFAFVASALASRVFGLRGRILRVLRQEQIFF